VKAPTSAPSSLRFNPWRAHRAEISVTLSDQADSNFLKIAREAGLAAQFVDGGPNSRRLSDAAQKEIFEHLERARVDVVVLAGFMRILKEPVISAYADRIVNVHPSLLPKSQRRERSRSLRSMPVTLETGCTVHLVTAEIDAWAHSRAGKGCRSKSRRHR
jgi:folate-dependent phosphoribosylglycinamide formyltransferase PurN